MVSVYAWPPVGLVAAEWTVIDPIGRSTSLITGGSYVSAAQRRRRVATVDVSALARGRNGAGYMEVLKRFLNGGVNLVRLYSTPINWHLDDLAENAERDRTRDKPISWVGNGDPLTWTQSGQQIQWSTGGYSIEGEARSGNRLRVTGLPPNQLVARPGEFVAMNGEIAMVVNPAAASGGGVAMLDLVTPLTGMGPVIIGARETGVFEVDGMPRAMQPLGSNWTYGWSFTEVFEDEGRGPFVEVDPWN